MNIQEYEAKGFLSYSAFADTVRFIIEQALSATPRVSRPQSIQSRAKGIESVRRRLAETENLETQSLESDRRDLAGVRLIFYTNNDVDRFLASSVIFDNLEVEKESTRVHHPTPDNAGSKYRAIHYTVRLQEERTRLPEYARFNGMRCEIQVHTILNHAWSETSHDILYKHPSQEGYGTKAMQGIARRFEAIMDKYLIPAGYEFQKAQADFERVLKGKELFDKNIVKSLDSAANNNELYDVLQALKDYALPHYDDLQAAYDELKQPFVRAVKAARKAERMPVATIFGNMDGVKPDMVTKLVVEIVEQLRYVDPVATLQILIDIFRDEENERVRKQILEAVKRMAEYNLDTYRQVGPMLQMALLDHLGSIGDVQVDGIRPIALAVWTEALQSDITGTKWKAESVELKMGAVPVSDQLAIVRDKAIRALFDAYDRSTDDEQRRSVLAALNAATRTPIQGGYSNELLATTIKNARRIVEFITERARKMSYELQQHVEHVLFYEYRRAKGLSDDPGNRFGCQTEADDLRGAILKFRDLVNSDGAFVKYKILVGFESVYPDHWINDDFEFTGSEKYRSAEADRFLEEINPQNADEWFGLINYCADTKSSDLATFPVFCGFLEKLAKTHPQIVGSYLQQASPRLRSFLSFFLTGLALSGQDEIYLRTVERELEGSTDLPGLARHLRHPQVLLPDVAARLLKKAIEKQDSAAVRECLVFALEQYGSKRIANSEQFIGDAMRYLNDRRDTRWIGQAWFLANTLKFYDELNEQMAALIFENLGYLGRVSPGTERILARLAKRRPAVVWDFFGTRLARERDDEEKFEAIPYRFFGLEKELSRDPNLAIAKGLAWFNRDSRLFQYRGGRVLSSAFPDCTAQLALALVELVRGGGDAEADFALAILQNYTGQATTHVVLKEIVARFPDEKKKLDKVRSSIDSTGAVWGELGFADAWLARRELLRDWLTDERAPVKAFAETHIAELDLRIAAEHRRAEAEGELWKREFEEDGPADT